jgi:hypothetical protein
VKQFRKNKENLFVCEECGNLCKDKTVLSIHNSKIHKLNPKEYFDKWIKEENEGKCKICNKETDFIGRGQGYKNCCCKQHGYDWNHIQINKIIKEKYGITNIFQSKKIKIKIKKTKKEAYGNEYYFNPEKIKQTNLIKYGVEYSTQSKNNKEKSIKTFIEKYGVENPYQSEKIKEKIHQTNLEKYGVKNPMQNKDIFDKAQKSAFYLKQFKDTNIYYRGSYEFNFLEKYFPLFPDIINAKSIKYIFENKDLYYFPDFYIPFLNLIIEIKNSYLAKKDRDRIDIKEKATITNGFNYILIIDKDYSNFNSIFKV